MKNAIAAWASSLAVIIRSYRVIATFAVLVALWIFAFYEWLGLSESSGLLLILAIIWATAQLLATVVVIAGNVLSATEAATAEGRILPGGSLWVKDWGRLLQTLVVCVAGTLLGTCLWAIFDWVNRHSIEVASFLTFHSGKAVSHVPVEEIYTVIEGLLWIALGGFLLSFLLTLMRTGWAKAVRASGKLLARSLYRAGFVTSLLSVALFGGAAYELVNWHPKVPPGFWDYTQVVMRFALVLILLAAGWFFWLLSLARLDVPKQELPPIPISPQQIPR